MSEVTPVELVDPTPVSGDVVGTKEITHTPLVSMDLWKESGSVFVPMIDKSLTPEKRREAVRKVMKDVIQVDDKLNLMAGEMLYEVQKNEYWKEFTFEDKDTKEFRPFKTFDEYIEVELEYQKRKAYYLIGIYKKFVIDLALPTEALRDLEWSKAKELVPVINASNWQELLDKCKILTVKKVQELVKEMSAAASKAKESTSPGTKEEDPTVKLNFVFTPAQAENIQRALETCQRMTGSDKSGHLLDIICSDFMSGVVGDGTMEDLLGKLDIFKNSLERAFGVKIEITGVDTDKLPALKATATTKS